MTMTMTVVALAVLYSAYLAGKVLMELFPQSGFGRRAGDGAQGDTPAD